MKKYFLLFLLIVFLIGCNNSIEPPIIFFNEELGIEVTSYPKLTYFENEEITFEELEVSIIFANGDKRTINNYELIYDEFELGDNEVKVKYKNFYNSFIIKITKKEKLKINEYSNYKEQMECNISYTEYDYKYSDVLYGVSRGANMMIIFDEFNPVYTNIYGYEALINEFGRVIEKNTNVTLKENCYVISAHGSRISEIKNLNIGDYVLYLNNTLYVYKNLSITPYYDIFYMFYEYLDYLNGIYDIDLYNEYVSKLNDAIPLLEQLYKGNYIDLNMVKDKLTIDEQKNIFDHQTQYSYSSIIYSKYDMVENSYNYNLSSMYDGTFYAGGWRDYNTIVLYNKDNYRDRNKMGYEVGVNKDGIVVSKDVLVNLEPDGYILSGHTSGANFIINNIQLYDKIEIKDNKIYVYRDDFTRNKQYWINERNRIIDVINEEKSNEIPHDYEYIDEIINEIDLIIDQLQKDDLTVLNVTKKINYFKLIEKCIAVIEGLLIEFNPNNSQGIWYYPFIRPQLFDDTSKEGIINTLQKYKKMGINEIIIYPFCEGYCLFDSKVYKVYDQLINYTYGEYGNDYLKCFIEEAHKLNICVNAFTQTFAAKVSTMYNNSDDFYQVNYQGEKSIGSIYYYDICNDELQGLLIDWYKELVTNYDFDKIEYDIIRYPNSNLHNYLTIDKIPDTVTIDDHGYTEYTMNKFMNLYNLSGDLKQLIKENKEVRINWLNFKEQSLINFVSECSKEIRKIKPNIIITAAVLSEYESAKKAYLQDYYKWLDLGLIDEAEIMSYTLSNSNLQNIINDRLSLIEEYNVRIGISPRLDGRDIITDVKQVNITNNYKGYIIFANTLYYDDLFVNIMNLSMINKEYSPLNAEEEKINALVNDIIKMIENYYSKLNDQSYEDIIYSLKNKTNYIELINKIEDIKMKEYLLSKVK